MPNLRKVILCFAILAKLAFSQALFWPSQNTIKHVKDALVLCIAITKY